jgi:hypothetical protein
MRKTTVMSKLSLHHSILQRKSKWHLMLQRGKDGDSDEDMESNNKVMEG